MNMLEIKHLSKTYSSGFELNNISLHIKQGDFLVMFGADDAGKTAILYQIMGLHQFRRGEILFNGKDIHQLTQEERKKIRFVPDTVCMEDVIAREYFAMIAKKYPKFDEETVQELCDLFEVDLDTRLTDMTYNENKLVTIVGAIASMPELLILDEPMNFLTQKSASRLLKILAFLNQKGMSILMTVTESSEARDYPSHFIYLKDGAVAHQGIWKDLYGSQKMLLISDGEERKTYIFNKKKQTRRLSDLLGRLGNADIVVENLTLEEILDKDYTRWM